MSSTTDDEQDLAERLRHGDQQALAALFARHRERLWRIASFRLDRRLHGRVDADDLLQEAYLAAVQRLDHYASNESLSPLLWLRLIVMQTVVDIHRHHLGVQRRDAGREVSLDGACAGPTTSASLANWLAGSMTSPSQAAGRAEIVAKIEAAIAEMNPTDQEVLALRHFEELTNSEVAAALGIEQKAASIRYVRALARLQSILAEIPGLTVS